MTTDAINIHAAHLTAQLGEDGVFTECAVYDPTGAAVDIYGIFDDNTYRGNKDSANVYQEITGPRFVVSSILDFEIYDDQTLHLASNDTTYIIDYVDTDEKGAQVIWLRG